MMKLTKFIFGLSFSIALSITSNAQIDVLDGGSVGIGNLNPQYKLDVNGSINFTDSLFQNGVPFTFDGGQTYWIFDTLTNRVVSAQSIDIQGDINYTGNLLKDGVPVEFGNESLWSGDSSSVKYGGNVGIGTDSPISKLHINNTENGYVDQIRITSPDISASRIRITADSVEAFMGSYGSMAATGLEKTALFGSGMGGDVMLYSDQDIKIVSGGSYANPDLVIRNGGDVGIGTVNPTYKLDVVGDINFTGSLLQNGQPFIENVNSLWNGDSSTTFHMGNVGIGTVTPQGVLELSQNGGNVVFQSAGNNNSFITENSYWDGTNVKYINDGFINFFQMVNGDVRFRSATSGIAGGNANLQDNVVIKNDGNVGIGTITPSSRLTLSGGNFEIRDGSDFMIRRPDNGWDWRINQTGTRLNFHSGADLVNPKMIMENDGTMYHYGARRSTNYNMMTYNAPTIYFVDTDHNSGMIHMNANLMYFLSGSGVGSEGWSTNGSHWPLYINMTNDEAHFGGNMYIDEGNISIRNNVASGALDTRAEYQLILYGSGNTSSYGFGVRGNTLVSQSHIQHDWDISGATKMRLESTGNLQVVGDIVAYSTSVSSDKKLKDNIEPIQDPINKLGEIKGVSYDWRDGKGAAYGVIAQEVEKVLPNAVKVRSNLETNEEYKTVDYNAIIALLVEVSKKQSEEIEILKSEIEKLKR